MEIRLEYGIFYIGDYSIMGDYEHGYVVWRENKEDEENTADEKPVYSHISLEHCIVWCLNS